MKNKKIKIYINSTEGKISDSSLLNKHLQKNFVNYDTESINVKETPSIINDKVPIRKGCPNKECFCTGACQEIIAWRDKLPNEH